MADIIKSTGAILRTIRQGCGHTLVDTADRTGRTIAYVSRVERDREELCDEYLAYLAEFGRAYGVTIDTATYRFAGVELFNLTPMTVSIPTQPEHTAADMAAVLAGLFPDGPAVLSIPGDDEGNK